MDAGWSPAECLSCQFRRECTTCVHGMDDLRQITRDTPIHKMYIIFKTAIQIGTFDMDQGYNLASISTVLDSMEGTLDCNPEDFWRAQNYFLHRQNAKHRATLQSKGYYKNKTAGR